MTKILGIITDHRHVRNERCVDSLFAHDHHFRGKRNSREKLSLEEKKYFVGFQCC